MQTNSDDGSGVFAGLLGLALLGWVLGWWGNKVEWTGYVYPNADLVKFYKIGPFKNFEDCQQSAIDSLRGTDRAAVGSYECGSDCKLNPDYGFDVCKETRK